MNSSKQKDSYSKPFHHYSHVQSYKVTTESSFRNSNQLNTNINDRLQVKVQRGASKGMNEISAKSQITKNQSPIQINNEEEKRRDYGNIQTRNRAVNMKEELLREKRQEKDVDSIVKNKLTEVEKYLGEVYFNQHKTDINQSNLPQNIKKYLTNLRGKIERVQKLQNYYHDIKKILQKINRPNSYIKITNPDYYIGQLAKIINDRRVIEAIINAEVVDIAKLTYTEFTREGISLAQKISKIMKKNSTFQNKMKQELLSLLQKKSFKDHKPYQYSTLIQSFSIEKVFQEIKQHLVATTKQQCSQAEKNNMRVEAKYAKTDSVSLNSLEEKYKQTYSKLQQIKKETQEFKHSSQVQNNSLKCTNIESQKKINYLQFRIPQLLQNQQTVKRKNDQLQKLLKKTQQLQELSVLKANNSSLLQQNQRLKEQLSNIAYSNKTAIQTIQSIKLAAKYTIDQYQLQNKIMVKQIQSLQTEKKGIIQKNTQLASLFNEKLQQIKCLETKLKETESQLSKRSFSQEGLLEKKNRLFNEYNELQGKCNSLMLKQQQEKKIYQKQLQQYVKSKKQLEDILQKDRIQYKIIPQSQNFLSRYNQDLKRQNEKINLQIKMLNSQFKARNQTLNDLNKKLIEKDEQLTNLKHKNNNKNASGKIIEAEIIRLRSQVEQQTQVIAKNYQTISSKQQQLQSCLEENRNLSSQLQQADKFKIQYEMNIVSLQKEITQLKALSFRQQHSLKVKIQEIEELTHNNNSLQKMLDELPDLKCNSSLTVDEKHNESQNKIKQLEAQVNHLAQQLKNSLIAQQQLQYELKNKSIKTSQLAIQSQQKQRQEDSTHLINELQLKNACLKSNISQIQESSKLIKVNMDDYTRINALYQHQLLVNFYHHKQFLTETIENRYNMHIKRTKLLYTYDTLNKVNFHQYIDNISNLLLVLKTAEGMFVAAYSEGPFLRKTSDKDGIIFSLTHRKFFTPAQQNRRAITYDEYYIIFGNSQIRLKSQEKKIFSNFAINNSYYNTKGEKVTVLLGGGQHDRETEIESYEIYQLFFDDF